jgi:hypothetical protein
MMHPKVGSAERQLNRRSYPGKEIDCRNDEEAN